MTQLAYVFSWEQELEVMERQVRDLALPSRALQILEAGCGKRWNLNLQGVQYVLTGVDLDETALNMRMNNLRDLHSGIVGDLRSVRFEENYFDVIYCYFVLEHIEHAEIVLENFRRWLKPTGVAIIKVPDPYSVHGFFTRVTPHWFHVWFYRRVLGVKNAGKPGFAPYPTHYDGAVSRQGLKNFCARRGLEVVAEYGDAYVDAGSGVRRRLLDLFKRAVSFVTLGSLSSRHTNLLYIVRKGENAVGSSVPAIAHA
jgi:SAM-dependent methyltransferase